MAIITTQRRRQRQQQRLFWMLVIQAVVIFNISRRRNRRVPRGPRRNWDEEREMILTRMFGSNDRICRDILRMKRAPFQRFCARLRTYGLVDNRCVKVEEQVAIFLNTVGHDNRNRTESFTFFRSGQTISYYFHTVLQACLGLYRDVVKSATVHNSPYEKEKLQPWFEYFKDSVGAIDGTHFPANVPIEDQARYRNRKQMITQNVLVACTFDMKFTFVLAGWEGSAHDGRLLRSATLRQGHRLTIPIASMSQNRLHSMGPFPFPRPAIPSDGNDSEKQKGRADQFARSRQVRWSDDMDALMITSLVEQVLAGHKRSDNGFTAFQVSKAMERVLTGCGVTVSDKNVRARLKTLKKEHAEVRQLLSISGFGLDPDTSRIIADSVAWDELIQGKPEFGKWKIKSSPRYDEMETIFGNDAATGERAVSGFDHFSPLNVTDDSVNEVDNENVDMDNSPASSSRKRTNEEVPNKAKRRRAQPVDESTIALLRIADSSSKIAQAMELQARIDTNNYVNWQLILEKLEGMNQEMKDIMEMMKLFQSDDVLAKVFQNLTSENYMRALVSDKLGRDQPPPS